MIKKSDSILIAIIFFTSALIFGCTKDTGKLPVIAPPPGVCDSATYTLKIKTIIDGNCATGCHSGATPSGGVSLTTYTEVKNMAARIKARAIDVIPSVMPPSGKLSQDKLSQIQCWLDKGTPQ